jgi:nicotinamidase-related amidase
MNRMTRGLLVIDVQESFRARPDWRDIHNPHIAEQVNRLVGAARATGDQVFWVLHSDPGSGSVFDPNLGHVRLMDELDRRPEEPLVVKTSVNAFTTTNLQQQLVRQGIHELVVCGIRTEQCCETTTRLATDLGFDVTFVTDATTTSAIGALSAAQIIERTEDVLAAREFARIATTDELVAAVAAVSR